MGVKTRYHKVRAVMKRTYSEQSGDASPCALGGSLNVQRQADGDREVSDIKLQIIHNMSLDPELKPSAHKAAVFLLVAMIDRRTGWCFITDVELARCIGVSVDNVRRHVRTHHGFLRYFEVTPGRRKGVATEYRITHEALSQARLRKSSGAKNKEQVACGDNQSEVVNFPTYRDESGGKNYQFRRENLPKSGGKNYPPNPVNKPSKKPRERPTAAPKGGRASGAQCEPAASSDEVDMFHAETIKKGEPWLCTHISADRARRLVTAGLVTVAECQEVGVL